MSDISLIQKLSDFLKSCKNSRTYFIIFYFLVTVIYVIYYGVRDQVDFTAFHRAASLFLMDENPYDRNYPFYFLNAPSALIFIFPLGLFEVQVASILFRCINFVLLFFLVWKVKKDTHLELSLILSILILSTPIRTTFGSGLGGIFVAISIWYLISPYALRREPAKPLQEAFWALGILSFKPYLFAGIFILYLLLRRFKSLFCIFGVFAVVNIFLSVNKPLIFEWVDNMRVRSSGLASEDGASSIVSIISRLGESSTLTAWIIHFAWPLYVIINSLVLTQLIKTSVPSLKACYALIITMSLSLYVNHRDYVLIPIVALILLASFQRLPAQNSLTLMLRCGLLTGSAIFQLVSSLFEPRRKSLFVLTLIISLPSFLSGYFWHKDLEKSFLIYDSMIVLTTLVIFWSSYKIQKSLD